MTNIARRHLDDLLRQNPDIRVIGDDDAGQVGTAVPPAPSKRRKTRLPQRSASLQDKVEIGDGWVKIVLLGERPTSTNETWAGIHWSLRKRIRDRAKMLVELSVYGENLTLFPDKVWIQVTAYMAHPVYDSGNIETKPYIDALQGIVIENDNGRFVEGVLQVARRDDDNPRLEILIGSLGWGMEVEA